MGKGIRRASRIAILAALLTLGVVVAAPSTALAADLRQGQTVVVPAGQTVNDDLYAGGATVDIQGTVNGSVYAAGSRITVTGTVTRDVVVAGGTIDISGRVGGSVRAAGGTVSVTGPVAEDAILAGGTVTLPQGAGVGRDLILAANSAQVSGRVSRNVRGSASHLTLDGPVGGYVSGAFNTLTITSRASVSGHVWYWSNQAATVPAGAAIHGITRFVPTQAGAGPVDAGIGWLRLLVGLFALGLVLTLLVPGFARTAERGASTSPWAPFGVGLTLLVGVPIVSILVIALGAVVGGWWIGLLALGLYAAAVAIGFTLSALVLARWGFSRFGAAVPHPVWALLSGLVVLTLVGAIPFVGWVVSLFAVAYGLGLLAISLWPGGARPAVSRPQPGPVTGPAIPGRPQATS